jgi:hypothetical protein
LKVVPAKPWSKEEKPIEGVNIVEITIDTTGPLVSIPVLLENASGEADRYPEAYLPLNNWK